MLEILGGALSAVVSGGMTGILGVVVQRIADYKNKQLDLQLMDKKHTHEVKMREVDALIMQQEWAARTEVASIEAAGREAVADSQAFAASFNEPSRYSEGAKFTDNQAWLMVILDFIRGIVRPGLTIYLCILTTFVYFEAKGLLANSPINETQAYEIIKLIIGTILYLTTTCLLWWFGSRNKQVGPKLN
jgi:hypothetical protein